MCPFLSGPQPVQTMLALRLHHASPALHCEHICTSIILIWGSLLTWSSIPSGSYMFSVFLFVGFPEPKWEGFDGDNPCRADTPRSLPLCMSGSGVCVCSRLMQEEAFLMKAEQGIDVCV